MKKKIITLFSIFTLVFVTSCTNQDDSNTAGSDKNAIIINDNQGLLNKRLDLSNSGVISIINPSTGRNLEVQSAQLPLTQIAEFNAPKDSKGNTLQASHVAVNGNYAYVSYISQGNEYSGAIDMIDISDPYKPKLVMSALISDIDISSLVYSNGKLILAGAADVDKNATLQSPAIVMELQLNSDGTFSTNLITKNISSFVATDVVANSNNYFAVSGDTGSLFKFDNTGSQVAKIDIEDLRTVAVNNDKIVTLSGTKGISVFNASNLELTKSFATFNEGRNGSKRTIDFAGDKLLVAEGAQGLGVYSLATGSKNQTFSIAPKASINTEDAVTNAVSVNGDYVFVANGGNGLDVYKTGDQLTLVGSVGIDGSANYVKTSGDYIYVASGKGGLKIIKMEKPTPPAANTCGFPTYNGVQDLILRSNTDWKFSGPTAIQSLLIESNVSLLHCGALTVQKDLTVSSNSILEMNGDLIQGQATKTTFTLRSNSTLKVNGAVVIWGDMDINANANITFVGSNASITIKGKVTKAKNISITGTFNDTENKLK
jgi:hypothetical protein